MDKYAMVTLDSVYIVPEHRRKGYCTNILYHIISSYPNQYIGVSKPISPSMQKGNLYNTFHIFIKYNTK